jgi:hypothetical protein
MFEPLALVEGPSLHPHGYLAVACAGNEIDTNEGHRSDGCVERALSLITKPSLSACCGMQCGVPAAATTLPGVLGLAT